MRDIAAWIYQGWLLGMSRPAIPREESEMSTLAERWPIGMRVRATAASVAGNRCREVIGREGEVVAHDGPRIGVDFHEQMHTDEGGNSHSLGDTITTYTGWWMHENEIEAIQQVAESATIAATPAPSQRLRVTISQERASSGWQVRLMGQTAYIEPNVNELMAALPPAIRRRLYRVGRRRLPSLYPHNDYSELARYAIERGFDPAEIAGWIKDYIIRQTAIQQPGSYSVEADRELTGAEVASQPPYMIIGNQCFQLVPREQLRTTRVLSAIRSRGVAAARIAAEAIRQAATEEARLRLVAVEREKAKLAGEIAAMRESGRQIFPPWVIAGYHIIQPTGDRTFPHKIGIYVSTRIRELHHNMGDNMAYWDAVPLRDRATYHHILCMMPIDLASGKYNFRYIGAVGGYYLPHICVTTCLTMQGLPEQVTNEDEYKRLALILNRGCEVVNLDSLLSSYDRWHPQIQAQVPEEVKQVLLGNSRYGDCTHARLVPIQTEAEETFTVEALAATVGGAPVEVATDEEEA